MSTKVTVDLISPDVSSLEDAWDITAESSPIEEEKEEDYIDIEDILVPLSPANNRNTRGNLKKQTSSGIKVRVITVVNKEKN